MFIEWWIGRFIQNLQTSLIKTFNILSTILHFKSKFRHIISHRKIFVFKKDQLKIISKSRTICLIFWCILLWFFGLYKTAQKNYSKKISIENHFENWKICLNLLFWEFQFLSVILNAEMEIIYKICRHVLLNFFIAYILVNFIS